MLKKFLALLTAVIMISVTAIPAAAAFEPDKDSALTKYYSFEGTIGDAMTLFKDQPDRTPHLDTAGGNIKYSDGIYGQGFDFDGETGLFLGNDIVTGNNYTIAMWFNAREVMAWTSVFHARYLDGDDEQGNDEFWMCIRPRTDLDANPDRNMMFWTCGSGLYDYWFDGVSSVNVQADTWYHVALTVAGEDIVFYVDGEISFDTRTTDANYTNNIYNVFDAMKDASPKRFYLGLNEMQDWPFRGTMDEFYSFNRTLSQAEITELMNYNPAAAASADVPEAPGEAAHETPAPAALTPSPVTPAPQTGDDAAVFIIIAAVVLAAFAVSAKKTKKLI